MEYLSNEVMLYGGGFKPTIPEIEFLYRIIVDCDEPIELDQQRIIPITGGVFEGPKIKGTVLSLGADWNNPDPKNSLNRLIDTRYVLKTDDNEMISLFTKGFAKRSEEVWKRRTEGEIIDPQDYYFRQHLFFETSSIKYQWLNNVVAFGCVMSRAVGRGVIYDAYILK